MCSNKKRRNYNKRKKFKLYDSIIFDAAKEIKDETLKCWRQMKKGVKKIKKLLDDYSNDKQ